MVKAAVMVSHARRQVLTDASQPIPEPQYLNALIDTVRQSVQ